MAAPALVVPASADPTTPGTPQSLAQLNNQLTADQAKLNDLNDQVERAQAGLDALDHKLADDQLLETKLDQQLRSLGRLEYEQPSFTITSVLEARSLSQLLADLAQAQLVARKEGSLLNQAHQLRYQDQLTHNQMSDQLAQVKAAREQAAQVAEQALALRNVARDSAARALAGAINTQAQATLGASPPPGAWPNHFAFGYCTWYVATRRYVPWFGNAIEWWPNAAAYGYPEGQTPRVGAIMVTRESGFGHVAYVESVNGSSWTVSEMNFAGWDIVDRRTLSPGQAPVVGFIYG
jgi:surface antigen